MGSIAYIYSADGVKLTKTVTQAGQAMNTHYRDGFQYIEDDLDFFPHAEGTVEVTQNPNLVNDSYNYIFHYLDHLGNIRIRYAKDTSDDTVKILEEKHYYPFGLQHKGYNQQRSGFRSKALNNTIVLTPIDPFVGSTFKYGFNGMEEQNEFDINMYDFGARNYDPALGRWMNIDPLAEQMRRHSPYNFAFNNPIVFTDPDGMAPEWKDNGDGTYTAEAGDSAASLSKDANISMEEANNIVESQLGENYTRESDGMLMSDVEVDDVVSVPEQVAEYETMNENNDAARVIETEIIDTEASISKAETKKDSLNKVEAAARERISTMTENGADIPGESNAVNIGNGLLDFWAQSSYMKPKVEAQKTQKKIDSMKDLNKTRSEKIKELQGNN